MERALPEGLTAALAGRYRLERELGAGGMATVYAARDLAHDREVAVKVLRPELGSVLGAERFLAEIRVTAKLNHPHIVTLLDSGTAQGLLYYVLPLIRGESLRHRLAVQGRLGLAETTRIIDQVAGALAHAHAQGVVHRDIKPENILLHEGEALLSDFGLALAITEAGGTRLTSSGISLGTPLYMSPEQASGSAAIGPASDQFSLAAMAYEMLTGETPHAGSTTHAIMARLLTETPTRARVLRPDLPPSVDETIARGLQKTPADRFPTVSAFADALRAPPADSLPTVQYVHRTARIRPRPSRWLLGVATLLALGFGAWRLIPHRPADDRIGGTTTQVTTSGRAYSPIIAPDGTQIAYADRRCRTPAECVWAIVVRETTSDESRTILDSLTGVFPYQWTDDGRWLLFSATGGRLAPGQYAVSRLGERIVPMGQGTALFIPGSDSVVRAAPNEGPADRPAVIYTLPSPWIQATDSIRIYPPRDHVFLTAYRRPARGRWWVYGWTDEQRERGILSTHDASGHLIDSVPAPGVTYFRWAPGGRSVIVPLSSSGGRLSAFLRIGFDPATGRFGRRDTLALPLGVTAPGIYDLTPDGKALAYQSDHLAESKVTVIERPGDPRRRRTFPITSATSPLYPALSPDGRSVLVLTTSATGDSTSYRWWITAASGGELRPLTPPFPETYAAAVTNEALYRVAFDPRAGSSVVRHAFADGASRTVLDHLPAILDLAVGAHGTILLIRAAGDSAILYDSAGAVRWRVGVADSGGRFAGVLAAPDGERFALPRNAAATADAADGNVDASIMELSARTGILRTMTVLHVTDYLPLTWATDGALHLRIRHAGDYRSREIAVDPRTGRQTDLGPAVDVECSPSADRQRAVCLTSTWLSDIYLFRGTTPIQ